ncbi:MAG: CD225/dispanin family protein [Planctomycetes bacterium]|nr:CD225/dispanin family protein [Planctomycetota bacterium]
MGGLFLGLLFLLPVLIVVRILKSRPKVGDKLAEPIFCRRCGTQGDGIRDLCLECGEVLEESEWDGKKPPTYLGLSILTTIFCCMPFGIVAIVCAAQVNSYWETGNFKKATELSHEAITWCWVAIVIGVVAVIAWNISTMFSMVGPSFMFGF